MSDDVITLDSSDEETQGPNILKANSLKKPQNVTTKSMVGPFPVSVQRARQNYNLSSMIPNIVKTTKTFRTIQTFQKIQPAKLQNPVNILSNFHGVKVNKQIQAKKVQIVQMQNMSKRPIHQQIMENTTINRQIQMSHKPPNVMYSGSGALIACGQTKQNAVSQKVINTLPPGITIKRTTGSPKVAHKRPSSPADVVFCKKSKPVKLCEIANVSSIPTYELDDDEEDRLEVLPIEYDPIANSKITIDIEYVAGDVKNTKKNDLITEEKENNYPPLNDPLELDMKLDNLVDNQNKNVNHGVKTTDSLNIAQDTDAIKNTHEKLFTKCSESLKNEKELNNVKAVVTDITNEEIKELASIAKPVILTIMLGTKEDLQISERIKKLASLRKITKSCDQVFDEPISEIYQRFIDLCLKLDTSDDMKKIIDKKVLAYYKSVNPRFTSSKSFCEMVEGKIQEITNNPSGIFLYIKAVVEELKVRRVKLKKESIETDHEDNDIASTSKAEENEDDDEEENEEDSRTNRHIIKLERTLHKLNKAIQKLEEKEVDSDDDNYSSYILADRYKSRLVRVYDKLCSLTGERNAIRRKSALRDINRLPLARGRLKKVAEAVKTMASKKPYWFPDYREVLACVEQCAKDEKLDMRPYELQNEARLLFVEIGTMLQQRRQQQEYEDMSWRLGSEVDPADSDPALALALQLNREKSAHKEMEVINKFAEKQVTLHIEPEYVEDIVDSSESCPSENECSNSELEDDQLDIISQESGDRDNLGSVATNSKSCLPLSNGHVVGSPSKSLSVNNQDSGNKTPDSVKKLNDLIKMSPIKDCKVVLSKDILTPRKSTEDNSSPVTNASPTRLNLSKSPQKVEKVACLEKNVMVQIHCVESTNKNDNQKSFDSTIVKPLESGNVAEDTRAEVTIVEDLSDEIVEHSESKLPIDANSSKDVQNDDSDNRHKSKMKSPYTVIDNSDDSLDSFDSNPSLIELSSSSEDESGNRDTETGKDFKSLNTTRPDSVMSGMAVIEDSNSNSDDITT